jgi:hypothetical protein
MSDGFELADVPKGPTTISPVKKAVVKIPIRIHPMFQPSRGTELPLIDVVIPLYTGHGGVQGRDIALTYLIFLFRPGAIALAAALLFSSRLSKKGIFPIYSSCEHYKHSKSGRPAA